MSKLHNVNCAGQGCPERDDCKRYVKRVGVRAVVNGKETVHHEWASLDVERAAAGSCAAKEVVKVLQ